MPSVASRIGGLVCAVGAVLVFIGYSLPWITYRVWNQPPDGTIEVVTWTGWREIAAGFPLSLALFGLPLIITIVSASIAIWQSLQGPGSSSRRVSVASLIMSLLSSLATMLLLRWILAPDTTLSPEAATVPGAGLSWLLFGYAAVITGSSLLAYLKQPPQTAQQLA